MKKILSQIDYLIVLQNWLMEDGDFKEADLYEEEIQLLEKVGIY